MQCDCFRIGFILPSQQMLSQNYYSSIIDKMASWAGWNGFAGLIWPAGCSLETPALKPRIGAYNPKKLWATKSARLFESQGMTSSSKCKQICINILSLCKHQQKTRDLKLNIFCPLSYKSSRVFRGLEQLSSLFWRRVMAIYKLGVIHPRLEFVGVEILTTFWFLWHNFDSR